MRPSISGQEQEMGAFWGLCREGPPSQSAGLLFLGPCTDGRDQSLTPLYSPSLEALRALWGLPRKISPARPGQTAAPSMAATGQWVQGKPAPAQPRIASVQGPGSRMPQGWGPERRTVSGGGTDTKSWGQGEAKKEAEAGKGEESLDGAASRAQCTLPSPGPREVQLPHSGPP